MEKSKKFLFIEQVAGEKIEEEQFKQEIRLFSQYLVYSNEDYKYNETYLESFCVKFLRFKHFCELKNKVYSMLVEFAKIYIGNIDLEISVDKFLKLYTKSKMEEIAGEMDESKICRNEVEINCKLHIENKSYQFLREYVVVENNNFIPQIVEKIFKEISCWIWALTEEEKNEGN